MPMIEWENEYPSTAEYADFYSGYVELVNTSNIINALKSQMHEVYTLVHSLPIEKGDFAYDVGKWTLKEVIGHIIETERLFSYRAFSISRGEKNELPSMDQDQYMKNNLYHVRTLVDLLNEFLAVRISTIHLLSNMNKRMISKKGIASGYEVSVRALSYIIVGHVMHHLNIIKGKYLLD